MPANGCPPIVAANVGPVPDRSSTSTPPLRPLPMARESLLPGSASAGGMALPLAGFSDLDGCHSREPMCSWRYVRWVTIAASAAWGSRLSIAFRIATCCLTVSRPTSLERSR